MLLNIAINGHDDEKGYEEKVLILSWSNNSEWSSNAYKHSSKFMFYTYVSFRFRYLSQYFWLNEILFTMSDKESDEEENELLEKSRTNTAPNIRQKNGASDHAKHESIIRVSER